MNYCSYYQATLDRKKTWFVAGSLRNEANLVFDRTLDQEACLHEYFVTPDREKEFLAFMQTFIDKGLVHNLQKFPNRLEAGNKL